jgi:hypothetical protein
MPNAILHPLDNASTANKQDAGFFSSARNDSVLTTHRASPGDDGNYYCYCSYTVAIAQC